MNKLVTDRIREIKTTCDETKIPEWYENLTDEEIIALALDRLRIHLLVNHQSIWEEIQEGKY